MKTLWNILSYIILFLKLEYSNCQCTFPDLWLEEADTNPISDLNLTFREGNKAAVVSFNENNKAGDILTLYYDGDKGPPTFIATSMQAGNCSEGKCTISVPMLDFEINQTPLVIAICPLESVTVTVDLQDVNDNEPFFTSSPSRMNYPENEEGIIERQICGSDLDKADVPKLTCSVLINEIQSQNFRMVPGQNSNGNEKCFKIEVFKALDFEEQTTYLLEIVLSDGLFNASTYVPLIVEDRPDQPPQWSRFPSIISFPENTQVGHVIAVFLAIDGDHGINQPIRYELREGNENIDLCPQTGNLTLVKQIDRDVNGAKSYVLEFEIFAIEDDFSSEGITGDVLMTVTDVNDNIPTFSYPGPYTVWVPEGTAGTIIFNHFIEVTDRDFGINGSYSAEIIIEDLDVATEKLQIINTLTGTPKGSQVTNYSIICIDKNFLDYKFETEINFKVKVTEDADISHFSEANFTITLEEINDKVDVDDEQLYMVLFYVTATILVIIVIAITAMYIMKVRRHEREVRALMTAQRGIQDLSLSKTGSTPPSTNTFREGTNPVLSVDEEKVLPDNTNNDHQGFDISVHQSTSPVPETAGQLYGASGSNPNRIDSSIHAKAKNQSHAGAADENRPKNGVRLTISTLNDETFLGIGANKLGVTIETEA